MAVGVDGIQSLVLPEKLLYPPGIILVFQTFTKFLDFILGNKNILYKTEWKVIVN